MAMTFQNPQLEKFFLGLSTEERGRFESMSKDTHDLQRQIADLITSQVVDQNKPVEVALAALVDNLAKVAACGIGGAIHAGNQERMGRFLQMPDLLRASILAELKQLASLTDNFKHSEG